MPDDAKPHEIVRTWTPRHWEILLRGIANWRVSLGDRTARVKNGEDYLVPHSVGSHHRIRGSKYLYQTTVLQRGWECMSRVYSVQLSLQMEGWT